MNLTEVKKTKTRRHGVVFLKVSTHEAMRLIESLAAQVRTGSPNTGRWEQFLDDGRDFSIAVVKVD